MHVFFQYFNQNNSCNNRKIVGCVGEHVIMFEKDAIKYKFECLQ